MDKNYELQGIEFEWDEEKYAVNLWKHSVKFEEAAEVFFILEINSAMLRLTTSFVSMLSDIRCRIGFYSLFLSSAKFERE